MAGKVREMIDHIVNTRAKGDKTIEMVIKTKMIMKGVDPDKYYAQSYDDPIAIAKLDRMNIR